MYKGDNAEWEAVQKTIRDCVSTKACCIIRSIKHVKRESKQNPMQSVVLSQNRNIETTSLYGAAFASSRRVDLLPLAEHFEIFQAAETLGDFSGGRTAVGVLPPTVCYQPPERVRPIGRDRISIAPSDLHCGKIHKCRMPRYPDRIRVDLCETRSAYSVEMTDSRL